MSRMFKPEMEVVRFTEADVITASSDPVSFTFTNVGGTKGDGIINYQNQVYNNTNYDDFMTSVGTGKSLVYGNGSVITILYAMRREFNEGYATMSEHWNGTWYYNSDGVFRRTQS